MVWEIERKLAADIARPILFHSRSGTCWRPYVKGYTPTTNSAFNGLRFEDAGSTSSSRLRGLTVEAEYSDFVGSAPVYGNELIVVGRLA